MRNPNLTQVPSIASAGNLPGPFWLPCSGSHRTQGHHQRYRRTLPRTDTKSGCRRAQPHCPYTSRTVRSPYSRLGSDPLARPEPEGRGSPPTSPNTPTGLMLVEGWSRRLPGVSQRLLAPRHKGAPPIESSLHSHRMLSSFTFRVDPGVLSKRFPAVQD